MYMILNSNTHEEVGRRAFLLDRRFSTTQITDMHLLTGIHPIEIPESNLVFLRR